MKNLILLSMMVFGTSLFAFSQTYVKPYVKKDGTVVQGHYRSTADSNPYNNWSFPGNTNPYTGKTATGNVDTYLKNYYNYSYTTIPSVPQPRTNYSTNYSLYTVPNNYYLYSPW